MPLFVSHRSVPQLLQVGSLVSTAADLWHLQFMYPDKNYCCSAEAEISSI